MKPKAFVFENLGLKLASFIFAIILWFFVMSRGKTEMSFQSPLEFRNIPKNLELVGETTKSVDVWIQGQESTLRGLKGDDVKTAVDLAGAKEGEGIYYISPENVKVSFNLKVVRVNPSSIKVRLDRVITKTVELRPTIVGKPVQGYRVKKIEIHPPSITIEGLRREVDPLRFLRTEPIDITGNYEDFTQEGKVDASGKNIRIQEKGNVEIKVFITKEGR
jgi:YbbR domain-containing protein